MADDATSGVSELKLSGGPPFPGAQVDESAAVAVTAAKPIMFCANPPHECSEHTDGGGDHGGANACVMKQNLWKRQVLRVYFMNPDRPKEFEWKYEGKEITPDMILKWANVWNPDPEKNDKIPIFEKAGSERRSDIRVEFKDDGASWSMVGMQAENVSSKKPTMALNLHGESCLEDQRSLVIHEFGHALGLEHEHQRSDFWDGVEKHIDVDRMKDDPRVKPQIEKEGHATFGDGWFLAKEKLVSTIRKAFRVRSKSLPAEKIELEYDPHSIMHYGFDKDWLRNPNHRDMHRLHSISEKELPEKKYLLGIHTRHQCLAKNPSESDLQTLQIAYGCCTASPSASPKKST